MSDLANDVRVAMRQWRRRPAMPLTNRPTLSAGIDAAFAVFAITWAVLWRPLDAPSPDRLVWIEARAKEESGQSSPGAFAAWQTTARTLTEVVAIRPVSVIADAIGTDRPVKMPSCERGCEERADRVATGGLAEHGDPRGVATESADVAPHSTIPRLD